MIGDLMLIECLYEYGFINYIEDIFDVVCVWVFDFVKCIVSVVLFLVIVVKGGVGVIMDFGCVGGLKEGKCLYEVVYVSNDVIEGFKVFVEKCVFVWIGI